MAMEANEKVVNILVVDDIELNLAILEEMIKNMGYHPLLAVSVREAVEIMKTTVPQLILTDISMPEVDGFEFCRMLKADAYSRDIPVIFISALDSVDNKIKGFEEGGVDFIQKPFEVTEVTARINNHLKIYEMQREEERHNKRLQVIITQQVNKLREEQKDILYAMAKLTETRDEAMSEHMANIGYNSWLLAQSLQYADEFDEEITDSFIETIEIASTLHDIGKIHIPDKVLLKESKLTEDEREVMKTHSELGARQLMDIYKNIDKNEFISMAIDIAYYHHEQWDGKGYPKGLKEKKIPLAARIVSLVDVYDALINKRVYKDAYTHEVSMEIINKDSGIKFDPAMVEVLNKIQKRLRRK